MPSHTQDQQNSGCHSAGLELEPPGVRLCLLFLLLVLVSCLLQSSPLKRLMILQSSQLNVFIQLLEVLYKVCTSLLGVWEASQNQRESSLQGEILLTTLQSCLCPR